MWIACARPKNPGVVSDQSLRDTAKVAKESYEAMRASGTASVRELQEGFKAYAEKAIAASGAAGGGEQRRTTEEFLKQEGL